ncbi:MAG: hypothetical protein ABI365_10580 [Lysobacteraceae bacterium]
MHSKYKIAAAIAFVLSMSAASAQERVNGVIERHGFLGRTIEPDEFQVFHPKEFQATHKVAISVFNVAFPRENHFSANTKGSNSMFSHAAKASMHTTMTGVDQATQQRIADRAYALFVAQLKDAGYEVVDQAGLAQAAPEYATWAALPNFSEGRFGVYVAPTGMSVRFLQGDAAKRDTSGMFGQQIAGFRVLDKPIAFSRSPYIAYDAKLGIIAVTLVVDYGTYSSSGEKRGMGKASAAFYPGATIAAGNIADSGTLVEYWSPDSGGFPAAAYLQRPVHSEKELGAIQGAEESGDYTVVADPAKFEAAANEVVDIAVPKLVGVMTAGK